MKKVNVAIMGLGVVGGGTYDVLKKNYAEIKQTEELDINIVKVLERNTERAISKGVPDGVLTSSIDDIINDKSISIVVETMGGVEPAKTFITRCLEAGKHIVSANKELIAKCWHDLEAVAIKNNVGLYFEASCVGGVPIIRTLTESMQANNIEEITGIYNGTTNYILTKMTEEKISYEQALSEAKALGYAEADPTSDVEAYDAVYKLSILSSLAFHTRIPYEVVYREGITKITPSDIESGRELGYVVKLLAIAKKDGKQIEVRCHPAFVPTEHPLASVRGAFNAVFVKGDNVGEIMLYGRGAGALPTASAIVSDIIYCAKLSEPKYTTFDNEGHLSDKIKLIADFDSKYYFLIKLKDEPGMLGKIATVLGKYSISLDAIMQKSKAKNFAEVIFLTHLTQEKSVQAALNEIRTMPNVGGVESIIRVL